MAGPYECVVTIGGQSFADGIWRLLGPALEGLTNPLPIALPGFTNARMRVTQIVPIFPSTAPPTGALNVVATVELTAEALLSVINSAGAFKIALGPQSFDIADLTGSIDLPEQNGSLTNLRLAGGAINLGPGTGDLRLPPVAAALSGGSAVGTLALPDDLTIPPVPFPAIVPVAVDLTPSVPLTMRAALRLAGGGATATTRFGLLFMVLSVDAGPAASLDPTLAAGLTAKLQCAVDQMVAWLGIPTEITQPTVDQAAVAELIEPIPALVAAAFDDALTRLLAETGRLVFPLGSAGASCDVKMLPTAADARLIPAANGSYVLQVGFKRPGSTDIPAFPSLTPGALECQVLVGNSLLLDLICCLVERLPAFKLPFPPTRGTTDIKGAEHLACCTFRHVNATFGPMVVGGGRASGISICIDGGSGQPKTVSLVGHFEQPIPTMMPAISNVADVKVDFMLPLAFDLDDAAAIANLRPGGVAVISSASVSPTFGFKLLLLIVAAFFVAGGGLIGAIAAVIVGPIIAIIVLLLVYFVCDLLSSLLAHAAGTVLSGASQLRSPVAVPPGLFEAFGRFSPASVTVDDLTANGVLHTPTSPWALLPRIGLARSRGQGGQGTTAHVPTPPPAGRKGRSRKAGPPAGES